MSSTRHNKPQRGLSLIELMVSIAISATLLAGVTGVYVTMFQGDRTQEAAARIQESGRFALNFLSQEVKMAGFLGCSSTLDKTEINNAMTSPPASFQPTRNIQGWEADTSDPGVINASVNNEAVGNTATSGWSTSGGASIVSVAAMPGTDMLRVWYADPTTEGTLTAVPTIGAATATLTVSSNMSVTAGDILMLSDCDQADWVHVCTVTPVGSPATAYTLGLSSTCAITPVYPAGRAMLTTNGARVQKVNGTVFYIGKRGDTATNLPSLFRRTLNTGGTAGTAEELVEGVENMQILYGENTDNDSNNTADRFVPADNVSDWDAVVSVRITLLIMSIEDNLVTSAQAYTYNGVVYNGGTGNGAAPPDKRLRRVFTTTISLRNVTLGG